MKKKLFLLLIIASIGNMTNILAAVSVLRVNPQSTATEDGLTWDSGFKTITAAIAAAGQPTDPNVVEIWVKQGTYSETTFVMQTNVNVYGGFIGNETTKESRNWKVNETILTPIAVGKRVIIRTDATSLKIAVWDGFTITGASGNTGSGGGAWLNRGNTLRNCKVINNHASATGNAFGGGVYMDNGSTLENCIISGNSAKSSGGGIACGSNNTYEPIKIINCVVENNVANVSGGGINVGAYNTEIYNSLIANNTASGSAGIGGFVMGGATSVVQSKIINCTVVNNLGGATGFGGISAGTTIDNGYTITNNIIYGNRIDGSETTSNFKVNAITKAALTYNAIENLDTDSYSGSGNINLTENQFQNPSTLTGQQASLPASDWSLTSTSVCVNVGDNASAFGSFDLAGNTRIQKVTVDLGAYESPYGFETSLKGIEQGEVLNYNSANKSLYASKEVANMKVFNLQGALLLSKEVVNGTITLPTVNIGIYIVSYQLDNKIFQQKIFVK